MAGVTEIKCHMRDAWRAGKLSHAYIISGGSSRQRRDIADSLAQLLLGRNEATRKQLESGTHPDLFEITHEKPASISVDDIRRQLSDTVDTRPYGTDSKLYIIDEADKMTAQAQNAVLKTIEEPPEYVSILLMTRNPEILLETIRSRCVDMKITGDDEELSVSPEHIQILRMMTQPSVEGIMNAASELKNSKDGIIAFISSARLWMRDILFMKLTGDAAGLALKEEAEYIKKSAASMSLEDIEQGIRAADEAESRIESNVNTELTLQLMLMEMAVNKQA